MVMSPLTTSALSTATQVCVRGEGGGGGGMGVVWLCLCCVLASSMISDLGQKQTLCVSDANAADAAADADAGDAGR